MTRVHKVMLYSIKKQHVSKSTIKSGTENMKKITISCFIITKQRESKFHQVSFFFFGGRKSSLYSYSTKGAP